MENNKERRLTAKELKKMRIKATQSNPLYAVIALIIFWPYGLYNMWKNSVFNLVARILISIVLFILVSLLILSYIGANS